MPDKEMVSFTDHQIKTISECGDILGDGGLQQWEFYREEIVPVHKLRVAANDEVYTFDKGRYDGRMYYRIGTVEGHIKVLNISFRDAFRLLKTYIETGEFGDIPDDVDAYERYGTAV